MNSGVPVSTVKSLAKQALAAPPAKKPVKLVEEKVTLADGSTFTPMPVTNANDALRASLLMLFKHVADVHVTVVEIVAEKFGLQVDEIHKAITDDPRWHAMLVNPLISDLTAAATDTAVVPKKKKIIQISTEPDLVFD